MDCDYYIYKTIKIDYKYNNIEYCGTVCSKQEKCRLSEVLDYESDDDDEVDYNKYKIHLQNTIDNIRNEKMLFTDDK